MLLLAPFLLQTKSVHSTASTCTSLSHTITAAGTMAGFCVVHRGKERASAAANEHAADVAMDTAAVTCRACIAAMDRAWGGGAAGESRESCQFAAAIMRRAEDGGLA